MAVKNMANLSSVSVPHQRKHSSEDSGQEAQPAASEDSLPAQSATPAGPRKLVRPTLPARVLGNKNLLRRNDLPALAHHAVMASEPGNGSVSTHAEAFYFQKQAQAQIQMVFILEDGERIEGVIEWYDRNVIKVRNHSRTLIYKSSIKYLYKANENQPHS
jgi:sRNA-binding regulator protein Hfq